MTFKLNIVKPTPTAVVITPSVGSDKLIRCLTSMDEQSHPKTKHLVVYDGRGKLQAEARIDLFNLELNDYVGCEIPFNTGAADGGPFYGHRIYAAFAHLVNCDYVFFCDEDNWYEPDHVANAIAVFEKTPSINIVYSLRKIFSPEAVFLCEDNCESLGIFPAWTGRRLADTSSLAFRREFLVQTSHLWHSGWGGDQRYLDAVTQNWQRPIITGTWVHSLNYRLDGNPNSVTKEFFEHGNAKVLESVNGDKNNLPWIKLRNQHS